MFATWAADYLRSGVSTFPVDGKRPIVRNYVGTTKARTRRLIERYPSAKALGIGLKKNNLTVVDIDVDDPSAMQAGLKRFGDTPLVVQTQSGGYHLYFRNSGEGRLIRFIDTPPIDLLGDGFVVAPPSSGEAGQYRILRGRLEDLSQLPPIREAVAREARFVPKGFRNVSLWRHCMTHALHCGNLEALEDVALAYNSQLKPELGTAEIKRTAASAWDYTIRGENWFGSKGAVSISRDLLGSLSPHEVCLYLQLRAAHAGVRDEFVIAIDSAPAALGLTRYALRKARDGLLAKGVLIRTHEWGGRKGDPHRYRFAI